LSPTFRETVNHFPLKITIGFIILLSFSLFAQPEQENLTIAGLQQPVKIFRDANGVNHIYAENEHDLFFAQGFCAARDRLFQFEIWRRQATGTIAEILGEEELLRDVGAKLFRFRGNLEDELNHYHPRGAGIIRAFTEGINAWITQTRNNPSLLPVEFSILKMQPGLWTPEVVISRHQGLLNNLTRELQIARAVAAIGPERVKELVVFEPGQPMLNLSTPEILNEDLIAPYEAFRKALKFTKANLGISFQDNSIHHQFDLFDEWNRLDDRIIGSNNWIVSGKKSTSGFPMLANDPHRALATPSLRYLVHLSAPGWNVVGGGEPVIPGVSIGHNDFGAWGLTIFELDAEDLYLYDLRPGAPEEYRYNGMWEKMRLISDTIHVKGKPDVIVQHRFTRHGPVTYFNPEKNLAAAVRAGWLEKGNAPYLASLRMSQARNWKEFRNACAYSFLPGENMIWADRAGNIGWQAVGQAPIRKNWSGLVPVPGDGRYEWSGFLPVKQLPNVLNPDKGFWTTANENNVPSGYKHREAVGWTWAEKFRFRRIEEALSSKKLISYENMQALQFDYLSIPARELVGMLKGKQSEDPTTNAAIQHLLNWDFIMNPGSVAAGIYAAWEKEMELSIRKKLIPEEASAYIRSFPLGRMIEILQTAGTPFNGMRVRDEWMVQQLKSAVEKLTLRFGADQEKWRYGQPAYHHVEIKHPLSGVVSDSLRRKLDFGPVGRGGNGTTPGMTGSSDLQTAGASFRMVVDTGDWDGCSFTNTPGQSGDPSSPFYRNLFDSWSQDRHFKVFFTRDKVEGSAVSILTLKP